MKIITYNVNSLRARVAPYRSLHAFLTALDADILCFQETKLSRQELTADIAIVEGYEAFFSCTRTSNKGKIRYSGVATFCRVDKSMRSTSGILPVAADEGFTGLLHHTKSGGIEGGSYRVSCHDEILKMAMSKEELLTLDSEGRCLVTDHGSFVLFNIYGPSVQPGDTKRMQFKLNFFQLLQCRWETLLSQGRAVVVVGDLNIAPFPIDSCDPGPDFSANSKDAYTFWSQASGAEEFNWGTRIDLILAAGPCTHLGSNDFPTNGSDSCHGFAKCELKDCDIMIEFKRSKKDSVPRWAGQQNLKLEGSDHAPVFVLLNDQPSIQAHNTPSLAARFLPQLRGRQQNIDFLLQKKCLARNGVESADRSLSTTLSPRVGISSIDKIHEGEVFTADFKLKEKDVVFCSDNVDDYSLKAEAADLRSFCSQPSQLYEQEVNASSSLSSNEVSYGRSTCHLKAGSSQKFKRKSVQKASQTSLRSFLVRDSMKDNEPLDASISKMPAGGKLSLSSQVIGNEFDSLETKISKIPPSSSCVHRVGEDLHGFAECRTPVQDGDKPDCYTQNDRNSSLSPSASGGSHVNKNDEHDMKIKQNWLWASEKPRSDGRIAKAQMEWRRIQDLMARRNPVCRGHGEPCVARMVKKGPNIGRGFYVCARAEGPASNPESRCDHFEWASKRK